MTIYAERRERLRLDGIALDRHAARNNYIAIEIIGTKVKSFNSNTNRKRQKLTRERKN